MTSNCRDNISIASPKITSKKMKLKNGKNQQNKVNLKNFVNITTQERKALLN